LSEKYFGFTYVPEFRLLAEELSEIVMEDTLNLLTGNKKIS